MNLLTKLVLPIALLALVVVGLVTFVFDPDR